ncbi:hypothetical protein GLOIN_2v1778530 [Rhizophagus clarus]|uniref:Uncharacterized protein n=1 Tax=Rhizophagus clarus TaxID=94130 RepID=A0A8H3QM69_9GLOM|nr:hypothetical protein GLOIN_2v1778530 [Rhizophagus clarus]
MLQINKKKLRKAGITFGDAKYLYGIITTPTECFRKTWLFLVPFRQKSKTCTISEYSKGFYPSNDILCYTSARSSDQFNYVESVPVFKIWFGEDYQNYIKRPNTQARLSGVHVFGLNLQELEKERERKQNSRLLKPFNKLSNSMKTKRVHAFSEHLTVDFKNTAISCFYPNDHLDLQEIRFAVQEKTFKANFGIQDMEKENQRNELFIKVIDQGPISRDSYQKLAALPRESQQSSVSINEDSNTINDSEVIEEVLKYIRKAGYRKIKDILLFILLGLINQNVLNPNDPTIHLRLSGIEKYEVLQDVMTLMINELNDLVINGLKDSTGKIWKIKPYFSSDWKFLSIILGFNASNANYFCPWYLCTKKDIGNKNKVYTIEKNMNQLNPAFFNHHLSEKPPPGHIKPPLLKIIPLDHYIADELHIMLRIWNRLWLLVLQCKIDQETQSWAHTSLMGGDKEAVLKSFDFRVIFNEERALLINRLWRDFYQLYKDMKSKETDPTQFANKAKQWLDLFLTPSQGEPNTITFKMGLYRPKDVTLPVEKKNHEHISSFFRKTMKDGGKGAERKSAIFEILHYENRSLYFTQKDTADKYPKPQRIHIKNTN